MTKVPLMIRKKHSDNPPSTLKRFEKMPVGPDRASVVASALALLATDVKRLESFLQTTGLEPGQFRSALADGSLQAGLIDHLLANQELLVAVAHELGCAPEALAASCLR